MAAICDPVQWVPGNMVVSEEMTGTWPMDFLSQTYVALRGPAAVPQTAQDTITKLADRLSPSTLLADRRAAVLALKGLSRDCKADVGEIALPGLLAVLHSDAAVDADIGKAVIETLNALCDPEDSKEAAFKHTDVVLASESAVHVLFSLLADTNFYTRFPTLQFLTTMLQNRRQSVQGYFLTAPAGPSSVIAVLEDKREIVRNGEFALSTFHMGVYLSASVTTDTPSRGYFHGSGPRLPKPRYPKGPGLRGRL